jgi:hypothetical protein
VNVSSAIYVVLCFVVCVCSFLLFCPGRIDEAAVSLGYREGKLFAPSVNYTQNANEGKEDTRAVSVIVASQPADTQLRTRAILFIVCVCVCF